MNKFTISEIADEFQISLRTLRFWEERKILSPKRRGQDRIYTDDDRSRVQDIVAWSAAGFSLKEISSMLTMDTDGRAAFLADRLPAMQSDLDRTYAIQSEAISTLRPLTKAPTASQERKMA